MQKKQSEETQPFAKHMESPVKRTGLRGPAVPSAQNGPLTKPSSNGYIGYWCGISKHFFFIVSVFNSESMQEQGRSEIARQLA